MNNKINDANRNSKSNLLNLSGSTSMQALEAKAARAALIAQAERGLRGRDTKPTQHSRRGERTLTELERKLMDIRSAFERVTLNHTEVIISRPGAGSSAVCVITTSDMEGDNGAKRTYVFYPSVTEPDRLGSVAIYGSDVELECGTIRRRGRLFGIEISRVSVEMGRRPFLDVTFRA